MPLEIEFLGQCRILWDGRPVDGLRGSRLESLVAYLVLHRGVPQRREPLASLLWPESSHEQALTNLRRELHALRAALPDAREVLAVDRLAIEWRVRPGDRLDVADFEEAVVRGRAGDERGWEEAVRLYRGPLVPTCYDDWIAAERERYRALHLGATEGLVAACEARGDFQRAIDALRGLLSIDPLHEPAYQSLIRIAGLAGDRSTGVQAYHAAVETLGRELGVEPAPETRAAYERLLASHRSARPTPTVSVASVARASAPRAHPLVGRDRELQTMLEAWTSVAAGPSKLLALRGEAGIGKTRLLEELVRRCREDGLAVASTRSYAAEGALAYAPIADLLRSPAIGPSVQGLPDLWLTELARVVPEVLASRHDLPVPSPMRESWQRRLLLDAINGAVLAVPSPLLVVLDDIHWADHESVECLNYLLRDGSTSGLLVAVGIRVGEQHKNAALGALLVDMLRLERLVQVDLEPLGEAETSMLAQQIAGRAIDEAALATLYRETGGHPLYVVELARTDLGGVPERGSEPSTPRRLPLRMQAVIAQRLAGVDWPAREVVDAAATVGRPFTVDLLADVTALDEAALVSALDGLWSSHLVREQALNVYDFSHDRIREVAYAEIPPARRRLIHRRVAEALERRHAADLDAVAGDLAAHFDAAGQPDVAIEWYRRAAQCAMAVSASADALNHLRRAIQLVAQLPVSDQRTRAELDLHLASGAPLVALRGYASGDFADALGRALTLAEQIDDQSAMAFALGGLASAAFVRARFSNALELATRASALAVDDPDLLTGTRVSAGGALTALGRIDESVAQFDLAVAAWLPGRSRMATGIEPGVFARCWSAVALWLSGAPGAALERQRRALELAADHGPHTLAMANAYAAMVLQFEGDTEAMLERAATAIDLCRRYGFAYYGEWGEIVEAWHARSTPGAESVARIERALASLRAIGAESRRPYFLSLLADTLAAAGRIDRARAVAGAALSTAHANEDRFWIPEIHRLLALLGPARDRVAGLRRALDIAREQGSRLLALRAATSLLEVDADAAQSLRDVLASLPEQESRQAMAARSLLETLSVRV